MSGARETLGRIVAALDNAGAQYMIVGSFASSFHGEPRTTQDIDIVVDAGSQELDRFVESLPESEWYVDATAARDALRRRSMFNVIHLATGWKVDVICLKAGAYADSEFSRRVATELLGTRVFIATAEDTVLAKLLWARESGSERPLRDAAGIVAACEDVLDRVYMDLWAAELGVEESWRRVSGLQT